MKTLNILLISTLLLLNISASAQKSSKTPTVKPTTLQGNGGPGVKPQDPTPGNGGPGGGNIIKDEPTNALTVYSYVNTEKDFRFKLQGAIRKLEYTHATEITGWPALESVLDLLFSRNNNGETVYQVIEKVHFNVLMKGPCVDYYNQEKDGAAYVNRNEICLSAERIARNTNSMNLPEKLYALIIHEVSHFMGTADEKPGDLGKSQAEILQEYAENGMHNFLGALAAAAYSDNMFTKDLLEQLQKTIEKVQIIRDNAYICGMLGMMATQAGYFSQSFHSYLSSGSEVLPLREAALVDVGLSTELSLMQTSFCIDEPYRHEMRAQNKIGFDGYGLISQFIGPKTYAKLLDPIKIDIMIPGHRGELLENLAIIKKQLEDIRASVPDVEGVYK